MGNFLRRGCPPWNSRGEVAMPSGAQSFVEKSHAITWRKKGRGPSKKGKEIGGMGSDSAVEKSSRKRTSYLHPALLRLTIENKKNKARGNVAGEKSRSTILNKDRSQIQEWGEFDEEFAAL